MKHLVSIEPDEGAPSNIHQKSLVLERLGFVKELVPTALNGEKAAPQN